MSLANPGNKRQMRKTNKLVKGPLNLKLNDLTNRQMAWLFAGTRGKLDDTGMGGAIYEFVKPRESLMLSNQ